MGKVAPDFDVAIVGLGPVGHIVAALLGQAGHSVGIFDRQPSLYPLPRIGHLDHEAMRIVQAVGDADAFEAAAYACKSYDWLNAAGQVLIHFDRSGQEATGWHSQHLFYRPDLDAVLRDTLARLPNVAVHRGREAVALQAADESVSIRFADATGSGTRGISVRYVRCGRREQTRERPVGDGLERPRLRSRLVGCRLFDAGRVGLLKCG